MGTESVEIHEKSGAPRMEPIAEMYDYLLSGAGFFMNFDAVGSHFWCGRFSEFWQRLELSVSFGRLFKWNIYLRYEYDWHGYLYA